MEKKVYYPKIVNEKVFVTIPEWRQKEIAKEFARELIKILGYNKECDADIEKRENMDGKEI